MLDTYFYFIDQSFSDANVLSDMAIADLKAVKLLMFTL